MKLQFDHKITTGNLLMIISFILPACAYGVTFWGRFDRVEREVVGLREFAREQQKTNEKLADNQHNVVLTLQHITDLLDSHVKYTQQPPTVVKP